MNMKELIEKFGQYKSAAKLKYDSASKAIANEEFEKADELRAEGDSLMAQAGSVKAQIDSLRAADAATVEVEPEVEDEPAQKTAVRPPFETEATEEPTPEPQDSFAKTVNHLKYGEPNKAVVPVIKDLFGADYDEKRMAQRQAFVKYIRRGEKHMNSTEANLLRELIYTPATVLEEIKSGVTVAEMRATKAIQQEGALDLGGWLVPEDFRLDVIKRLMGMTIMRSRARVVQTVRDKVDWPRLEGGDSIHTSAVRVTWVNENPDDASVAETNFRLGGVEVPVHTVMARVNVSRNLLEDSGVDVIGLISELLSEEMALDEDQKFLTGTGAGTPRGILAKRNGAEEAPDDYIGEVNTGAASALEADGLIDLVYEPDAQYLQNAIMIGAKGTFKTIRQLKDGNGDYLWARGLERGAPPVVLGYDYYMNEQLPAVGANKFPLIFGDMRGYLIADRVGMTIERVTDTTTVGRNYEALFARRRLGGQVVEPWRIKVQKVAS